MYPLPNLSFGKLRNAVMVEGPTPSGEGLRTWVEDDIYVWPHNSMRLEADEGVPEELRELPLPQFERLAPQVLPFDLQ